MAVVNSRRPAQPRWVEVYRRQDGTGFRLRAANHRILSHSEAYTRRRDAVRGAKRAHPGLQIAERLPAFGGWRTLVWPA